MIGEVILGIAFGAFLVFMIGLFIYLAIKFILSGNFIEISVGILIFLFVLGTTLWALGV